MFRRPADTGAAGELELEEDLEDELEEEAKGRIKNSFSDNLASLVGMGFMQEEARRLQPPGPGGGLPGGRGAGRRPPARHRQPSRLPAGPARVPAHAGGAVCNVQCELVQCAMCSLGNVRLCNAQCAGCAGGSLLPPVPPGRPHRLAGVPAAVRAGELRWPPHHARQGDGRPTHARPVAAVNV